MRISPLLVAATTLLTGALFLEQTASAATVAQACGAFDFSQYGDCELLTSGGCEAQCTPVNVDVECSADLYVSCQGGCNVQADVGCTGSCNASCMTDCTKPSFSCEGECNGSCSADCSGKCTTASNQSQCEGSCNANCSGECKASCSANPPDCTSKCSASCQGSCHAQANVDCQINCQASGYAKCEADVSGGCKVQCQQPKGALFCNGHYVTVASLDDCVAALAAELNIKVSASGSCASGDNSASCQGQVSASCAAAPVDNRGFGLGMFAVMASGVGLSLARRRSARKSA